MAPILSPSGRRIIRLPIQGVTMTSLWQKGVILVLEVTADEPWNRNLKSQGSQTHWMFEAVILQGSVKIVIPRYHEFLPAATQV